MRRLYALYGILSPFPQRPVCVVIMLGIYRPEFARWNFILAKKILCTVFFDNNDRRNVKLKTHQIRGGSRSYVT